MVNSTVYGCSAHSRKSANDENVAEVGFFSIPKVIAYQCARTKEVSTRRRAEWFSRINRKDMNRNAHHYRVCGKHFISGRPAYLMDESSPDWAPSLHLGHGREMNGNASSSRYTRKRRRAERSGSPLKQLHENANEESIAVADSPVPSEDDELSFDVGPDIQETPDQEGTDAGKADFSQVTYLTMEQIEHLENENRHLLSEVGEVRNKVNKQMLTEDCLTENEDMLQFYTGLPNFSILMALLEVLKDGMTHTSRNSLTIFQEMLIVLIRLRLNVPLQDLAYRLNVSQPTVSRVVNKWIDVAYVRLSRAVKWPGSKELQGTMPMAFRLCFGTQLAVILDCFEVFIERPSSLLPRSHTWSNYKHHNTVKYLIGIAPQGVVTFISRGRCGRSNDKVITEKCGVLNNLQPGDYVLADRGFTIGDSVGLHCAKLAIPAFTKGKPQLSACEVEKTRKLANLRIHVERVIGMLRNKYRMLKYTLPVEMLASEENGPTVLDKIVFVCAALCNLSNSTVPFG